MINLCARFTTRVADKFAMKMKDVIRFRGCFQADASILETICT